MELVLETHTVIYLAMVSQAFDSNKICIIGENFIVCNDTDVCFITGAWFPINLMYEEGNLFVFEI